MEIIENQLSYLMMSNVIKHIISELAAGHKVLQSKS